MSQLYDAIGTTRQAQHQQRQRRAIEAEQHQQVLAAIRSEREEHPRMGLRKLYGKLRGSLPPKIGRDVFIALGMAEGLGIEPQRNPQRTTIGTGERRYPNLLIGRTLNDINQVWVSDLTYYRIGSRFGYITFIMDLYSRKIVGSSVARSMHAHWIVGAFERALAVRRISRSHELILHSDQGGQFLSEAFETMASGVSARISTSEIVYENANAERLNGIIKHEYLNAWRIDTLGDLEQCVSLAIERYNSGRPHASLAMYSPCEFEAHITGMASSDRPGMSVWPPQSLTKLSAGVKVPYKL